MPEDPSGQVSQLLQHWVRGDEKALHELTPVVYQELRRLARKHLQSGRPYARNRRAQKRDGGCRIDALLDLPINGDAELVALDDALEELSRIDERQAKIVEMKFFGGLSAPEILRVMGLSRATVDREWSTAHIWLHQQMNRAALS
jgi:DNA-directed RNA polymerase specialized sigma subunit